MQKIILSLLMVTGFSAVSFAQQTKIGVQKGQKYNVSIESKVNTSAEVMGQTMENNVDSKSTKLYEITNNSGNSIDMNATITMMKVTASAMGQEMSYDSDKKDNEGPLAESFSPMMNKAKAISIDEKGSITKMDKSDNPAVSMMGGTITETTVDLFIPALIGKNIKVGDSFEDIVVTSQDKNNSRDSGTYKINSIENGVANISYTGTQSGSSVMEQMGMEMISNTSNVVKATILMDVKTGLILSKSGEIDMTISVEAAGMTIPAAGKTTISIKTTPAM